ncbi:MAG: VOC family protein [Gammaproteobacteria bacterium]|nr:VOC family protein [Gammaproteobacteria bacterium]
MPDANPINITHIDHVVIRVDDLESMTAWYRDVLGCKLERGPGDVGLAQLRAGSSLIDLVDAHGPLGKQAGEPPNHDAPNMDHVCFQVDPWDTEAVKAQLRRHDVKLGEVANRYGAFGMGPSIYAKDPEGNTVELKGFGRHNG